MLFEVGVAVPLSPQMVARVDIDAGPVVQRRRRRSNSSSRLTTGPTPLLFPVYVQNPLLVMAHQGEPNTPLQPPLNCDTAAAAADVAPCPRLSPRVVRREPVPSKELLVQTVPVVVVVVV